MSLDKAIKYGKEKRKAYKGSKAFDPHCRNNNLCGWCRNNRTKFDKLWRDKADEQLKSLDDKI